MVLASNKEVVRKSFDYLRSYYWVNSMIGMLGKAFKVLQINVNGNPMVIALPSPDGSQNGKYYFSKSVVSMAGTSFRT